MKKKLQRWARKQLGCPACASHAPQRRMFTSSNTVASAHYQMTPLATWPTSMTNGQSVTYTYRQRGDA